MRIALLPALLALGCADVDGLIYRGIPCDIVGPDTCEGAPNVWDQVCTPCDQPYDWTEAHPWVEWFPNMLEDGQTVRGIDPDRVIQLAIPTADGLGTLDAYFIPSHREVPALADTTLLYSHGNFASIDHYRPRVRILHELGYGVLVWDYRGYGKSRPTTFPTDVQFLEDARTIRAFTEDLAPDDARIVAHGYSLGALPSVEIAVSDSICALVLESGFTSAAGITRDAGIGLPESFLSGGRFANAAKIEAYEGPLLTMIGSDDSFFSVDSQRVIFDAAPTTNKEFWELPGVDHGVSTGGVPEAGLTAYGERLRGFLEGAGCAG